MWEAQAPYLCSEAVLNPSPSLRYDIAMCVPRCVPSDLWIRLVNITPDLPGNPWAGCALLLCVLCGCTWPCGHCLCHTCSQGRAVRSSFHLLLPDTISMKQDFLAMIIFIWEMKKIKFRGHTDFFKVKETTIVKITL